MRSSPTLSRALQAAAFNTAIALGITAFGVHDFISNLVYSQSIGLSIWLLVDMGQYKLIPDYPTQWRRLFWLVPLCVVAGYLAGTGLAGKLMSHSGFDDWVNHPRKAFGFLLVSLAAGGVITYFFFSRLQLASAREAMAQTQAQAEAAQRQATEFQLKLLQSQLEPHMLFNTLANLRALIHHNPAQAQHMLDHLVAYLRATLSSSRTTLHPLQTEFDRLRDYLELMAVRMGPRLSYVFDLPSELASVPVPALLLQPLVENAIQHGLEPKIEGGNITVQARLEGPTLILEVHDTGVGLPAGECPAGFGLTQVRERLATLYGAQATIEFIACHAFTTGVRVTFPYQKT
ncbi:MAG: histidine kinase [Comamonadaceae bacterium]|nr:MAG: histidine kinase [Comamonadaceae bacterium]